jgi:hypothetical protein
MNDTLRELESYQNQGSSTDPSPSPDHGSGPVSDSSASPESEAVGDDATVSPDASDVSDGESTTPQNTDAQNTGTSGQGADEGTRRDPTAEEIDAAFSEIARNNEDLADSMDRVDDDRMVELDGDEPWIINALEGSGTDGRGDGPGRDDSSPALVTPDGMEVRADHNVDNSVDGNDGPGLEDDDSVTIRESQDSRPTTTNPGPPSGGPPEPPSGRGLPEGPQGSEPPPDRDNAPDGARDRLLGDFDNAVPHDGQLPRIEETGPSRYAQPTMDELRDRIGEGWEYYDGKERAIAQYLHDHGIEVRSVDVARADGIKSPDSVVVGRDVTIEFKTPETPSKNAIIQNLRKAREQSSRVVIDARSVDTPQDTAMSALRDSLRRYGGDLEEVLVIGNDYVISWP